MDTFSSEAGAALKAADERLRDWDLRCKTWYTIHYAVGALGILLSALIAGYARLKPDELNWLFWLAIASAILQGFTTFFGARRKAAAYRAGWRILWLARQRLECGDERDPAKLLDAIRRGWRQLDGGDEDS